MLKHLIHLAKNSSWYLFGNIVSAFSGVLLLPLYTRFLTPADYGITAICASVAGFLAAFYQLGLTAAYVRFYFDYKDNPQELRRHVSTIVLFLLSYGLVVSLLVTFLGEPVEVLTSGVPFSPYIQLAVWSSCLSVFAGFRLNLYRAEQKARNFFILFMASLMFRTVLTIGLVVFEERGALGYIIAGLVSNLTFSVVSLWLLRYYLTPVIDVTKLKISLRYGLPLVPHMFAGWMYSLADRMILANLVNTAETGVYSIGYAIGNAMNLAAMSVNFAWSPFFFSLMRDKGDAAKSEVARFATYWIMGMCFIFLLLSIFSREIVTVFSAPQYHEAYRIVPLIALGFLFNGLYFVVANPLFWVGRTSAIAICTVTGGLLNVGLNFLLIPGMQMEGAAVATSLSHLYCLGFVACFSLRAFPLPYEYRRLFKIVAVTAICYLLALPIGRLEGFWLPFVAKLPIVVAFPLFLSLAGLLDREEKKTLKAIVRNGMYWGYARIFPGRKGGKWNRQ